ncbi:MAG: hypothetical protein KF706_08855 [Chitinophagales bacterium]|nr:hypothetical protein [Chitinophagales bacterium]
MFLEETRSSQVVERTIYYRAGFVFDMEMSWYWMPDIMDKFFADFGYKTSDFFDLISLNPQFEMIFF